jgi:2-methylcitrate dehydratase PrpD
MRDHALRADDIESVETGLSPMTHVHCAWEYKAQGVTAAQMNLYYGLAVIALDGMAFTEQYRESRLRDPRILDFITRISARVDPEIESMGAAFRHAARVKVRTRDARTFETLLLDRRGSPENPLSPADIEFKFRHVVAPCVSETRARRIVETVKTLEKMQTMEPLVALIAAAVE